MIVRSLSFAIALLALSAVASAQSFNVNLRFQGGVSTDPPPGYGGAGESPGTWNSVSVGVPAWTPVPLRGLAGEATTVTMALPPRGAYSPLGLQGCVPAVDIALLFDFIDPDCASASAGPILFEGLASGTYEVVTYAYQTDLFWILNEVEVVGSLEGPQVVGGANLCSVGQYGQVEGVSFVRHTVVVDDGRIEVDLCGGPGGPVGSGGNGGWEVCNGVQLVFEPDLSVGQRYCQAEPNSTGAPSSIRGIGSEEVSDNDLVLVVEGLPTGEFAQFLASRTMDFAPLLFGASDGNLCLGNPIGRFAGPGEIQAADLDGRVRLRVDLGGLPLGSIPVAAAPGETWFFQAWHRDTTGAGNNFSPGLRIDLH